MNYLLPIFTLGFFSGMAFGLLLSLAIRDYYKKKTQGGG